MIFPRPPLKRESEGYLRKLLGLLDLENTMGCLNPAAAVSSVRQKCRQPSCSHCIRKPACFAARDSSDWGNILLLRWAEPGRASEVAGPSDAVGPRSSSFLFSSREREGDSRACPFGLGRSFLCLVGSFSPLLHTLAVGKRSAHGRRSTLGNRQLRWSEKMGQGRMSGWHVLKCFLPSACPGLLHLEPKAMLQPAVSAWGRWWCGGARPPLAPGSPFCPFPSAQD